LTDRFAHHLKLHQIRDGDRVDLVADESERQAIAERLGLNALERFEAHAILSRKGEMIRAEGRLQATLEQSCVVTSDPVASHIDEPFDLMFTPAPGSGEPEEVELGETDCDVVFYDGAAIDLGSAIADTLALSIHPYPRSAGADATLKEAGVMSEAEASPFAALAKLRKNDDF
jgi:uncharacterized metal-binding protein YceD (DUF177 family)